MSRSRSPDVAYPVYCESGTEPANTMRRNHLSLASPLRPIPLPSRFSFSLFSLTLTSDYTRSLQLYDRVVRTPVLLCRLEFRSFDSSGSRQGTVLLPSSLPCRVPPLTASFANPATPSSSSLASLESLSLSLSVPVLYLSPSDLSELPLVLYYHLSSSCIVVLSSVFLPSHPATPANSRSPRPTHGLSLSLTKTSSFRRAPIAGRTLALSLALPLA